MNEERVRTTARNQSGHRLNRPDPQLRSRLRATWLAWNVFGFMSFVCSISTENSPSMTRLNKGTSIPPFCCRGNQGELVWMKWWLALGVCLFTYVILNLPGFNANLCYFGLLELSWMQVGAQVYRCMFHSDGDRSLVDPLTVILSLNTKLYGDRFRAVSIRRL